MRGLLFLALWWTSSAMGARLDRDTEDDRRKVRMKLAQCRSTCLAKCWQVCDLFYKDFDLWGPMCGVENICCWQVCDLFYKDFDLWGPMCGVENICTSYLNASVSRSQLKQSSQLKLLAMGPEGPAAQTLSPVDLDAGSQGLLTQDDARGHGESRTWTPRLVSLRWLRSSVEAMVTWDGASYRASDATPAKFEVMWKILDGSMDVTGRQYTSHDVATLTLWPEATYAVTVQRFGSSESPDSVSQALVIDTHGLQPEPRPLLQECPGVPEKAAHRLDMHSIKASSRLDFPGGCAVHEPMRHQVVQTSGPISPVGESREDLLDEDSSQSNYFVFDLNPSTCNAPRV
ncbi:hypothetical protein IscW_ISCW023263 [Ixodes scapularis]|uniref:Secreted protein n=1 Tax=Ixodes scapularis TaxID=6945 RepID=B7QK45_IXOSC|nr:hypothetical protein IscW_ISCW023263 [Ixodes scapularis]|eukprot:XP_002415552.1 hypothetical protein IscW_ISCW023263 [Ixodes scapularis]